MKKSKIIILFLLCYTMLVFSGCGKKEEVSYVRQAMALIENMQYEEAVTALVADNAMQESKKLSNRGLGLAYMGMEQYEEAIPYFREALLTNQGIEIGRASCRERVLRLV